MSGSRVRQGFIKGNRLCWAIIIGACFIAIGVAVGLVLGLKSDGDDQGDEDEFTNKPVETSAFGKYRVAAVASDSAICSRIGSDIIMLKEGSAADAAIATLLCNGLANSHSMGVGGGFFMTIYNSANKSSESLIAREMAPAAATKDMFAPGKGVSSVIGGHAIGIPGEMAGYWEVHRKYGKLPWKELFAPSIKLAREGIPIGKGLSKAIFAYRNRLDVYPALKRLFYDYQKKRLKAEGDTFTRPLMADTLETLANGNGRTFYEGSLARDIAADINDAGGIITTDDLKQYKVKWKTPVVLNLSNNMTMYSVPPPASGAVVEFILNILEGYNFSKNDISTDEKAILTYHRITEAMKFAYAKRSNLGDADFVDVEQLVNDMTSREYGDIIRRKINDDTTHDTSFYEPTYQIPETTGTAHISVVDKDGNAVAVTSTINTYFGSKVIGNRTGIIFNNEMDDFSTPNLVNTFGVVPSPANFIEPGKRPMSSMSPSIFTNGRGEVVLVVGASGGTKITTATALVSLHALKFGKDINVAIDNSRIHHQLLPEELQVEKEFSEVYVKGLLKKGHKTKELTSVSVVQAILRRDSYLYACSDRRKGGAPFGY